MQTEKKSKKFIWAFSTYFAEGFPFSIVRQISSVFFKDNGASLQAIGLTSLYGLPWVLKFLWAPFVDEFGTKRSWLLAMESLLVGIIILVALGSTLPNALPVVALLFLFTAIISATHDISIDGFYLENMNREEQAKYVGFQAMSYRIALVVGGGGIIFVSGVMDWWFAFLLAAGILGGLLFFHGAYLPPGDMPRKKIGELFGYLKRGRIWGAILVVTAAVILLSSLWRKEVSVHPDGLLATYFKRIGFPGLVVIILFLVLILLAANLKRIKRKLYSSQSFYALAFVDYLDQPKIAVILSFIVLYRTGESFLLNMLYPYLNSIGIIRSQYGLVYGTFGIAASIMGGLVGGKLISKHGLKKVIWPFVLSQNLLNLIYMFIAFIYQDTQIRLATLNSQAVCDVHHFLSGDISAFFQWCNGLHLMGAGSVSPMVITPLVAIEAFGAGLGTSAFMVFIMRTCKPKYKAANMAIATSIMGVSATLAGVFSGFLASWLGFTLFFGLTFLATIPSMALIPFLPHRLTAPAAHPAAQGPSQAAQGPSQAAQGASKGDGGETGDTVHNE